jgi:hypothetical protein
LSFLAIIFAVIVALKKEGEEAAKKRDFGSDSSRPSDGLFLTSAWRGSKAFNAVTGTVNARRRRLASFCSGGVSWQARDRVSKQRGGPTNSVDEEREERISLESRSIGTS